MQTNSYRHYLSIPPLDVFDELIKQSLISYIKDIGYSHIQLQPLIYAAISQSKELVKSGSTISSITILKEKLRENAKWYVNGALSQSNKCRKCREGIKAYRSVFLVGAGFSYGSDMPLSDILDDILKFCLIKDWNELRADDKKCYLFKTQFKLKCDLKEPSISHNILVDNFPKYILEIVCLNWDDLLEKAANLKGIQIKKHNVDQNTTGKRYLWKFHGDVEDIRKDNVKGQGGWVFPDEPGYVFKSFKQYINKTGLINDLFIFMIVGYSEKERLVYEELIRIFQEEPPRPTYRIGLELKNLHDDYYIVGPTDFILNQLF